MGLSSGEGEIWRIRDPIVTWEHVDEGVAGKRLLAVEQEFASALKVLATEGNTLSPVLSLAWDGEPLVTLTKSAPAKATQLHVLVVGHITRAETLRYLRDIEQAARVGNRCLWIYVSCRKCLPLGGGEPALGPLITRLREALVFARKIGPVHFSAALDSGLLDLFRSYQAG